MCIFARGKLQVYNVVFVISYPWKKKKEEEEEMKRRSKGSQMVWRLDEDRLVQARCEAGRED